MELMMIIAADNTVALINDATGEVILDTSRPYYHPIGRVPFSIFFENMKERGKELKIVDVQTQERVILG